jgi:hypothetical protein
VNTSESISKHFRDVHFGGNWTSSDLKTHLTGVHWEEATRKFHSLNTIASLVYHINYYISAVLKVLKGEALVAKDMYSFDHPPIRNQADWENMLVKTWTEAEEFAVLVAALPESRLSEIFVEEKYGTYYRNLQGIVEHTHYHLGQIVLIKKFLLNDLHELEG